MKTLAAAFVLCLARLASAGDRTITLDRTCVEIDGTSDSLAPTDREYAAKLLRQVLERENLLVVADECTESYRLSHEHVDDHYVIRLQSSAGKRRMTTASLDELYGKYRRMARSLLEAKADVRKPAATTEPQVAPAPTVATVEPNTVVEPAPLDEPSAPEQPTTEAPRKPNYWYGMLGAQLTGGAAITVGHRRKVASALADFSFTSRAGSDISGATLGMKLLGATSVSGVTSAYAGGGLSLGVLDRGVVDSYSYSGAGLLGELAAGLRFGGGRVQGLVQFDLTLPFFQLSNDMGSKTYAPTASLSGGFGW